MQTSSQDTIKKYIKHSVMTNLSKQILWPTDWDKRKFIKIFFKTWAYDPLDTSGVQTYFHHRFKHFQWSLNCVTGFYMLFKSKRKSLRFWSLSHRLIINYIFVFMVFVGTWKHDWLFMNRNKFFYFLKYLFSYLIVLVFYFSFLL